MIEVKRMSKTGYSPIHLNKQKIAEIAPDGYIEMLRKPSHIYRNLYAWCVNSEVLCLDYKGFRVLNWASNKRYQITRKRFEDARKCVNMFISMTDLYVEKQLAIPMALWDIYVMSATEPEQIGIDGKQFVSTIITNPNPQRDRTYLGWGNRLIVQGAPPEQMTIQEVMDEAITKPNNLSANNVNAKT